MKTNYTIMTAAFIIALLYSARLISQTTYGGFLNTTSAISQIKYDEPPLNYKPNYRNAIGIRAGGTSGLTVKHFMNESNALEGILGLWPNGFGITGLYERYAGTGVSGLKFYYGGGAHFSGETDSRYYYHDDGYHYYYKHTGFGIGIDGILGIEYKIPVIPFAISLDIKPFVEVGSGGGIYTSFDPGLGIKVAF